MRNWGREAPELEELEGVCEKSQDDSMNSKMLREPGGQHVLRCANRDHR